MAWKPLSQVFVTGIGYLDWIDFELQMHSVYLSWVRNCEQIVR